MKQSDDFMIVIKVEHDPIDGIVWRWWADRQYFRFDDDVSKEINSKLRDYFLQLMAEEGLLVKRDQPAFGLN
ncbi:MAG: hypothetical protein PVH99_16950 [Desulfobacteraceae bacterium]